MRSCTFFVYDWFKLITLCHNAKVRRDTNRLCEFTVYSGIFSEPRRQKSKQVAFMFSPCINIINCIKCTLFVRQEGNLATEFKNNFETSKEMREIHQNQSLNTLTFLTIQHMAVCGFSLYHDHTESRKSLE